MSWPEAAVRITTILVIGMLLATLIAQLGRRR